jgi:hypothetical protein
VTVTEERGRHASGTTYSALDMLEGGTASAKIDSIEDRAERKRTVIATGVFHDDICENCDRAWFRHPIICSVVVIPRIMAIRDELLRTEVDSHFGSKIVIPVLPFNSEYWIRDSFAPTRTR